MLDFTPATNPFIFGVDSLIPQFLGDRFPQSIILSGPRGVGKATFAYHLARYLLQGKTGVFAGDPDSSLFARVASGSHGDLKVVQRGLNTAGKTARDISIDSIRNVVQFLHSTPLEGGWRVVIIDSIDELNHKSANALLKTLEEPPRKTLIILISHSLGRVLPTIKSRCAQYKILPLTESEMDKALTHLLPDLSQQERAFLMDCAESCPGRAMTLSRLGGMKFYEQFLGALKSIVRDDLRPALAFTDALLSSTDAETLYEAFGQFFSWWLAESLLDKEKIAGEKMVVMALRQKHTSSFWVNFWSHATKMLMQTQGYSFDRRHVMLCIFYEIMVGEMSSDLQKIA
jgi:DNA polymerase-3 subunit delta'